MPLNFDFRHTLSYASFVKPYGQSSRDIPLLPSMITSLDHMWWHSLIALAPIFIFSHFHFAFLFFLCIFYLFLFLFYPFLFFLFLFYPSFLIFSFAISTFALLSLLVCLSAFVTAGSGTPSTVCADAGLLLLYYYCSTVKPGFVLNCDLLVLDSPSFNKTTSAFSNNLYFR